MRFLINESFESVLWRNVARREPLDTSSDPLDKARRVAGRLGKCVGGGTAMEAEPDFRGTRCDVEDEVKDPAAVRFGWANFPQVNLWNSADLPASPFRTDDFPGVTWPKQ